MASITSVVSALQVLVGRARTTEEQVASAAAIKRLAAGPGALPVGAVSDALNKAQGLITLGG